MSRATIGDALRTADIDAADARALLKAVLAVDHAYLASHPGRVLADRERERFSDAVRRRCAGEPVAYIVCEREFWSLALKVSPAVLIPRPETELLVELALERIAADASSRVLDLGTGSGCVAVAIAKERPLARVTGADASRSALAIARENAERHGARVELVESDWLTGLAGRRFDLIVGNPPYVAEGDPHLAAGDVRFEPRAALVGGADGLDCIRSVIPQARAHLDRGGWLFLEHGYDQAARCRVLLEQHGFVDVLSRRDLAGTERASGGRV